MFLSQLLYLSLYNYQILQTSTKYAIITDFDSGQKLWLHNMIDISFGFPFVLHNTLDRAHDISNAWIIVTCTYLVVLEMIFFSNSGNITIM